MFCFWLRASWRRPEWLQSTSRRRLPPSATASAVRVVIVVRVGSRVRVVPRVPPDLPVLAVLPVLPVLAVLPVLPAPRVPRAVAVLTS